MATRREIRDINSIWYSHEGDTLNSALSLASSAPFVGWLSTGGMCTAKVFDALPVTAFQQLSSTIGSYVDTTFDFAKRIPLKVDNSTLGMNFGNIRFGLAPKSTFDLPKTWRSAKGVTGKFSDGKHSFRIDTHNLSPGERFHVHIYDARGNEIAVIQGRGTNGIWRESHLGQTLLKPTEVSAELRTDIRRLIRNALNNIE